MKSMQRKHCCFDDSTDSLTNWKCSHISKAIKVLDAGAASEFT